MIKIFVLTLIPFFFLGKLNAQNYFPKGATWHYDIPPFSSPQYSYLYLESKGDTLVNGDTLINVLPYSLLKQIGNKLYQFNSCSFSYSLLYDFGAIANDTLIIFPDLCNSTDSVVLKIDSINTININGNSLKHFFITQINYPSNWFFGGNVIEGIGNTTFLFPQPSIVDPQIGPLRCYNDSIIGEYKTGLHNGVCDTTFSVGIEEYNLAEEIKVFPNPTNGLIEIKSDLILEKIELYNLEGKQILQTRNLQIDITNFPKSIYFLKFYSKQDIIYKRIVKE